MARELTIVDTRILQSMEIKKNGIRSLSRQQKYISNNNDNNNSNNNSNKSSNGKKKNTENFDQRFMTLAWLISDKWKHTDVLVTSCHLRRTLLRQILL